MPNAKRNRRARGRREPLRPGLASCIDRVLREVVPYLRAPRLPRTRSTMHLRNAAIEVLEGVRVLLDETIERLRKRRPAELKRIRVE